MLRLFLIIFISYIGYPLASLAQLQDNPKLEEYNSFEFFYIDNSSIPGLGGLDGSLIELLSNKLDNASKINSNKCWIYVSNGENPMITDNTESFAKIINHLHDRNTEYPSVNFEERKRITQELYKKPFKVKEKIVFHFFITDRLSQTIVDDIPIVLGMLPKDILLDYGSTDTEAIVYLYFKNNDKKANVKEILRSLEFSNSSIDGSKSMDIAYHVY